MDYQSRDRYEHDRCNNGRRGFNNFKVIQLIKNINNRKEEEKGDEGKVGGVKKKMNQLDTNDNNNKKLKKKEKKGKEPAKFYFSDFKDYQAFNSCNDKAKEGVTILVNRKHLANHVTNIEYIDVIIKIDLIDIEDIIEDYLDHNFEYNVEFNYKLIKVYLLDQTDQAFTWSGYQKTKGGEVNDRKKVVEKWEKFENIITEEWINRLEMDISNVE
ncbi:unnamed protein product [Rhizophagus irregularis]|nr:unnamed protein product [Rhizophagus irregularis]